METYEMAELTDKQQDQYDLLVLSLKGKIALLQVAEEHGNKDAHETFLGEIRVALDEYNEFCRQVGLPEMDLPHV
jgi:hypothetical protein